MINAFKIKSFVSDFGCETQTQMRQQVQLLEFHSNEVSITVTGAGNQTPKLSEHAQNAQLALGI